ncbi:GNAT family N-acetyltransferase [Halostella litorea]|uniref:GNAT family N-acetyltransferase n=1 Tax=Halostella litorea TaxID=2528831 RepID=UPI0010924856|nr:GNAT family N-acetyltransferase [Halostella litorea]
MQIDTPTTDDLAALVDLWVRLADEQRRHGSRLLAEGNRTPVRETIARSVVTGNARIARRDGDIVGFVTYEMDAGTYELDLTRGSVTNLFVRRDDRNAGVGSELLAAAERALAEDGADAVTLEVLAENEAARRFYRRAGYGDRRVVMEKALPDKSDTHSKGDR